MWKEYNPNPIANRTDDCTVRAICKALNQSWRKTYLDLCIYGLLKCAFPQANHVWGAYLIDKGFERKLVPETDCTVADFARTHPKGTYILAISGHVVTVCDGDIYDSWNSSDEIPVYYWEAKK